MTIGKYSFVLAAIVLATSTPTAVGRVLVEAHRGYSAAAPENTIASVVAAQGIADLTEFDVRPTSDGVLVVMHDGSVNRTTNGTGNVSSLTLAEIKALDAGSWFSPAFAGEQVPTMKEIMTSAISVGITPLVERKAGSAAAYQNDFNALGLDPSQFRVIAFDWNFLKDMNDLNPDYNLGALGSGTLTSSTINSIQSKGIDFLDWQHGSITQATVDMVHAHGMELHTWTVNSAARMQQLIDYGVDGITTDNPALLDSLLPVVATGLSLTVDRDTGDVWLNNVGTAAVDFQGYSLYSPAGAIDSAQWHSVADNYDAGNPGPDQIDPDNEWTKLWISDTRLSEAAPGGQGGATLAGDSSILLGSDLWSKTPFEKDFRMEVTLPGGTTESVEVQFEGNGGVPYQKGDFNFDGDLDLADWMIHNAGRGADLAGLSTVEGYQMGDFDGNGAIDMLDFENFKIAFESANGVGAFAAMLSVPEPCTLAACAIFMLFGVSLRTRRPRQPVSYQPHSQVI